MRRSAAFVCCMLIWPTMLLSLPICRAGSIRDCAGQMNIANIEVFVLGLPFKSVFVLAGGVAGSADQLSHRVLVKLTTASGVVGWGEATPTPRWTYETTETIVSTLRNYLAPAVSGSRSGILMHFIVRWIVRSAQVLLPVRHWPSRRSMSRRMMPGVVRWVCRCFSCWVAAAVDSST